MKIRFQYIVLMWVAFAAVAPSVQAQPDRREVRQGNRQFRKENWREADVDYRRALLKDSTSFAANYNLANTLYRQAAYDEAGKSLERLKEAASASVHAADYYYNSGDVALQKKDYAAAVEAFKQALLRRPDDLDAKENYIYAKKTESGSEPRPTESEPEPGSAATAAPAAGAADFSPAGPADAAGHPGQGERDPG